MENWGIPKPLQAEVRARDRDCVYCGVEFASGNTDRRRWATWEHIDNDRWDDKTIMRFNVALCCWPCNSSKGARPLRQWLTSRYCKERSINQETVADPVKRFLKMFPTRLQ